MEFKSQAQRAKFEELLKQGKITQKDFDKIQHATGNKKLPDRLKPKTHKKRQPV